jgi:hypothetical protein
VTNDVVLYAAVMTIGFFTILIVLVGHRDLCLCSKPAHVVFVRVLFNSTRRVNVEYVGPRSRTRLDDWHRADAAQWNDGSGALST